MAGDELPMWNNYGAKHGGLSFGFRPSALFGIPLEIQLVKYVDETSNDDYRNLRAQASSDVEVQHPPDDTQYLDRRRRDFRPPNGAQAPLLGLRTRGPYDRRAEDYPPPPGEHDMFSFTRSNARRQLVKWTRPHERPGLDGRLHYLEFPFGRFKDGVLDRTRAIAEVIIGPRCALSTDYESL